MSKYPILPNGKVVLIGESGVGKSTLLSRYLFIDNLSTSSNPSLYYKEKYIPMKGKEEEFSFTIYDTNGNKPFRPVNVELCKLTHAVLLVYNVNDKESFEQIKSYWYPEILKKNSKVIFALVGTFADVKDETKSVSEEEIKEFMTKTGILYEYKISSMNYENIKDVFNKIGECLLSIKP